MKKSQLLISVFLCVLFLLERVVESTGCPTFSEWKINYKNSKYCGKSICDTQLDDAEKMGNKFEPDDINVAVQIIYIYTHYSPRFHDTVNTYLRQRRTDDSLLSQYENLLIKAIDTICNDQKEGGNCLTNQIVYRGESTTNNYEEIGDRDTFDFLAFTSTSTSISVGMSFAGDKGTLFKIENANGIYLENYSAVKSENEVLIKPKSSYDIIEVTTRSWLGDKSIKSKINPLYDELGLNRPSVYPDIYVEMKLKDTGKTECMSLTSSASFNMLATSLSKGLIFASIYYLMK